MSYSVFQYPKSKHLRSLRPREFKRYQTYKIYLQYEFSRVCVYCRQPDSSAPNLNFGVDHYKPKAHPRFKKLVCEYNNLYYCCGACNSRKNNYWPADEAVDPFVVNPCDHQMASHLRFDSATGRVSYRSEHGRFTEELLQLNDDTQVEYRKTTMRVLSMSDKRMKELAGDALDLNRLLREGSISQEVYDLERAAIDLEIDEVKKIIDSHSGQTALKIPPKSRLGIMLRK